ncbi:MAG: hypothetical protein ACYDA4_03820 [Ignavibacteriaceae bacterium]
MKLIIILFLPFIIALMPTPKKYKPLIKKYKVDYCQLRGYTCIDCSSISKKGENEDDEPYAKLDNGMTFRFDSGDEDSFDEGDDVVVFAMKFLYQGKEISDYKLIINDEIIDVIRTR